jgi:hypothetical protein
MPKYNRILISLKSSLIISLFLYTSIYCSNKTDDDFTPWYTGPLLTSSANNMPPGVINIQPYIYVTDNYASYNSKGHRHNAVSDTISVQSSNTIQIGITNLIDITLGLSGTYSQKEKQHSIQYGDTSIALGFQLLNNDKNITDPSIRLILKETFPTGKYNQLNPEKLGLDSGGKGSYDTSTKLCFSKITYLIKNHPMRLRLVAEYSFPSLATVQDFHSYGGAYNTYGKIRPPQLLSGNFSLEYSFTQHLVYAMDIAYSYATNTKFSGTPGNSEDGSIIKNTSPSSKQWSVAPALEYNFNSNLGILAGAWFSIAGKDTDDFLSYVFSVSYTF